MKKQHFSLKLRKQKIAKLSDEQLHGGLIRFTLVHTNCLTIQINCKSLLIACDPLPTLPSGCGPCPTTHTQTTNQPTFITC
ncbi:class I lanthipeptide [uncultured Kordia sp.]|uniref:class I lanthipeptide n=1 Tax=uncultured Kordia sp. TaxID=507699 RepID=UPI0026327F13|nr:class I lanthipeptide [uncultured Kordia sp.]